MFDLVALLLFLSTLLHVTLSQWSALRHCPQQCSCTLQRTYVSMSGDYDEMEILCNRYAARFGANLSALPNMTQLKSNDYMIQMTMEQLEFETLGGRVFGGHKIKSLKIMNNLKLKVVQFETIASVRETLEELVVLGNPALEYFPYEVLAVLSHLKFLSLQFTKNHTRWKSPIFPHVTSLETLTLTGTGFGRYLKGLAHLYRLKQLSLTDMNVGGRKFVERRFQFLAKLSNLTSLAMENVNLTLLPPQLGKMNQLKHLFLKNNRLPINRMWPDGVELPVNVELIDIRWNNYESFPCKVFDLRYLGHLKTDMEILCFLCADDKKKIAQLKSQCQQTNASSTVRRKNVTPNALSMDDIEDGSGWYEEYEEDLLPAVDQQNLLSAPKVLPSAAEKSLPLNVIPKKAISLAATNHIVQVISSTSSSKPSTTSKKLISDKKLPPPRRIPTTTATTVTYKAKSTKVKNKSLTTLRPDYFYEDAPVDYQKEDFLTSNFPQ